MLFRSTLLHIDGSSGLLINDSDTHSATKTSFIPINSGGNSLLKVKGGNYIHTVAYETSWNDFEYARLVSSYNTGDTRFDLNKSASDGSFASRTRISTGDSYFNGNVGIGTTSPALQSAGTGLHINATDYAEIKFTNGTTGSTATDGTALVASGSGFQINNREAGEILLRTNNTTAVAIASSGDVSFYEDTGTTAKLFWDASAERFYGDTTTTSLRLSSSAGSQLSYGTGIISVGPSLTYSGAGSERFRITDQGLVGIGASSPDGDLEVVASTTVSGASDSVNNVLIGLQSTNRPTIILDTADTTYTNRTWNITNVGSEGTLRIGRNGLDVMSLKNDGKVGIGTDSPSQKLDVAGHININTPSGASQSGYALKLNKTNSSSQVQLGVELLASPWASNTNGGNLIIKTANSIGTATTAMTIDGAQNVGIGTTSPGAKLHVDGLVKIGDTLTLKEDGTNDEIKSTGNVLYVKAPEYSFQDNSNNQRIAISSSGVIEFNNAYTFPTSEIGRAHV